MCNEEEFADIPKDILIHFISSEHLHVDSEYQVITVLVVVNTVFEAHFSSLHKLNFGIPLQEIEAYEIRGHSKHCHLS